MSPDAAPESLRAGRAASSGRGRSNCSPAMCSTRSCGAPRRDPPTCSSSWGAGWPHPDCWRRMSTRSSSAAPGNGPRPTPDACCGVRRSPSSALSRDLGGDAAHADRARQAGRAGRGRARLRGRSPRNPPRNGRPADARPRAGYPDRARQRHVPLVGATRPLSYRRRGSTWLRSTASSRRPRRGWARPMDCSSRWQQRSGSIPERVLHFGDNAVSDLAAAREAGARRQSWPTSIQRVGPSSRPSPAIVAFADRAGTDGALGAAVRETLVSSRRNRRLGRLPVRRRCRRPGNGGIRQLGVRDRRTARRIDGALPAAGRRGDRRPDAPHTPERSGDSPRARLALGALRAAVFDGTAGGDLHRHRASHPVPTGASGVGLRPRPGDVRRVLTDEEYHHDHRYEAMVAVAGDDTLREQIVASSTRQRRTCSPTSPGRSISNTARSCCAISDGAARSRRRSTPSCAATDSTGDVVGLYLMLSETGVKRRRERGADAQLPPRDRSARNSSERPPTWSSTMPRSWNGSRPPRSARCSSSPMTASRSAGRMTTIAKRRRCTSPDRASTT